MGFLTDILGSTRARVAELKQVVGTEALEQRVASMEAPRGFAGALAGDGVAVIAEIKRASPARGPLALDLNPRELAGSYREGGAAAISVVTEPDHFRGSMEDLGAARGAGLPVLRKDFIVDPFQLFESRAWGADAVLLIVRCLGDELATLYRAALALGMDALVEVHDEGELERALETGAPLIGINHRNLETFEVDPGRTAALAPLLPAGRTVVSLSGVATRPEVERLAAAGAAAVLVGESLVTAADPAALLRTLRGSP